MLVSIIPYTQNLSCQLLIEHVHTTLIHDCACVEMAMSAFSSDHPSKVQHLQVNNSTGQISWSQPSFVGSGLRTYNVMLNWTFSLAGEAKTSHFTKTIQVPSTQTVVKIGDGLFENVGDLMCNARRSARLVNRSVTVWSKTAEGVGQQSTVFWPTSTSSSAGKTVDQL